MNGKRLDELAERIWNYMLMGQELRRCDLIFALGGRDERVAEYAAHLMLGGFGDKLVFSGGRVERNDVLMNRWSEETEAEHFANVAKGVGVSADDILLETKAQNTGDNITLTHEMLADKGMQPKSVLLLQKPYMERRTYATFVKQWPKPKPGFIVSSPPIPYDSYFNRDMPKDAIINIMVGDLQRIREYPQLGYQVEQDIPDEVWDAYHELIALGYDKHLISRPED